jgi:hypothetical protein
MQNSHCLSKLIENALKEIELKCELLAETIPDIISIFDRDETYIFLNHFTVGITENDIAGKC